MKKKKSEPLRVEKIGRPEAIRGGIRLSLCFNNGNIVSLLFGTAFCMPWVPGISWLHSIILRRGKRGKTICAVVRDFKKPPAIDDTYQFWHTGGIAISQRDILPYLRRIIASLQPAWKEGRYSFISNNIIGVAMRIFRELDSGTMPAVHKEEA